LRIYMSGSFTLRHRNEKELISLSHFEKIRNNCFHVA
jgi:hypothetical protein